MSKDIEHVLDPIIETPHYHKLILERTLRIAFHAYNKSVDLIACDIRIMRGVLDQMSDELSEKDSSTFKQLIDKIVELLAMIQMLYVDFCSVYIQALGTIKKKYIIPEVQGFVINPIAHRCYRTIATNVYKSLCNLDSEVDSTFLEFMLTNNCLDRDIRPLETAYSIYRESTDIVYDIKMIKHNLSLISW